MPRPKRFLTWIQNPHQIHHVTLHLTDGAGETDFRLEPLLVGYLRQHSFGVFEVHVRWSDSREILVFPGRVDRKVVVQAGRVEETTGIYLNPEGGKKKGEEIQGPVLGQYAVSRGEAFVESGQWLSLEGWVKSPIWFDLRAAGLKAALEVTVLDWISSAPIPYAEVELTSSDRQQQGKTDADGAVSFSDLEEGAPVELTVRAPGYQVFKDRTVCCQPQTIRLQLGLPAVPMTVEVRDRVSNLPIAGATALVNDGFSELKVLSDAKGLAVFPEREVGTVIELTVTADQCEPFSVQTVWGQMIQATLVRNIPVLDVSIQVIGKLSRKPVPRASVRIKSSLGELAGLTDDEGKVFFPEAPDRTRAEIIIHADGHKDSHLVLEKLGSKIRLKIGEKRSSSQPASDTRPAPRTSTRQAPVPAKPARTRPPADFLMIRILDESTGRPLPGTQVRIRKGNESQAQAHLMDELGQICLENLAHGQTVHLTAQAEGYEKLAEDITVGSRTHYDFYLIRSLHPDRNGPWWKKFFGWVLLTGSLFWEMFQSGGLPGT